MADLRPRPGSTESDRPARQRRGRDRDRGQMLLIGGLAVAVIFVVLALVVNSAIFTGNLASRTNSFVGGEGEEILQGTVERNVETLVVAANDRETGYADQEAFVVGGTTDLDDALTDYYGRRGVQLDVAYVSYTQGSRIYQSTPGTFEDADPDSDWELADDRHVRAFRFTADPDPLGALPIVDTFHVVIEDDDGDEWQIFVYEGASGDRQLEVRDGGGTLIGTCTDSTPGPTTTVDVTAATVAGTHCNALDFFKDADAPYDVEFDNGDRVQGTYELTTDTNSPPSDAPNTEEALYDVTVDIEYHRVGTDYVTSLEIAPGDPDE